MSDAPQLRTQESPSDFVGALRGPVGAVPNGLFGASGVCGPASGPGIPQFIESSWSFKGMGIMRAVEMGYSGAPAM